MKKNLKYYLDLPYRIEINAIPEEEGGGFLARLPQFGKLGIVGDGESIEEALADLEINKKSRFKRYLNEGLEIPDPESKRGEFSGRFVVRMPKSLHRALSVSAKENGVSLNQFVNNLLSMNFQTNKLSAALNGIQNEIKFLSEGVGAS